METIYHYTSLEGFQGIMHSSTNPKEMSFWMSSSDYLNDDTERIHCVKVLANMLTKMKGESELEKVLTKSLNTIANNDNYKIRRYFNQYILPTRYSLVLSFSEKRDYLPMWGRYAEDGNGIAIGINKDKLKDYIDKNYKSQIFCFDIDYSDGSVISGDWFNLLIKKIAENKKVYEDDPKKVDEIIANLLIMFSNIFKDMSFSYEKEVRLCAIERKYCNNKLQFRLSRTLMIPYINLTLDKNMIQEIIIGPNKNPVFAKQSITDFLFSDGGIAGCSSMVKSSIIPLRGTE